MAKKDDIDPSALGPNMWLIDEIYRQYRADPESVGNRWREFFEDFRPTLESADTSATGDGGPTRTEAPPAESPKRAGGPEPPNQPEPPEPPAPSAETATVTRPPQVPEGAERIRFGAERVVKNMARSLSVPTATSVRFIPAKLLEENRRVINRFLAGVRGGGKVSSTHLIGWAVVQGLEALPVMKSSYLEVGGVPSVVRHDTVNLGLAVDVVKEDGSRSLLVPNIRGADRLDFAGFWAAYEDVIRKVRTNKLTPDDFVGTTITLSNPGTIGTQLSVPRLMAGQGLIVATGRIDYPTEYKGADPATLAGLGGGKGRGGASTYDHPVIQGGGSGGFLRGGGGFSGGAFPGLRTLYEPVRWSSDRGALERDGTGAYMEKQAHVLRLINMYRVRGHLLANLDPLGPDEILSHPELDPGWHGLSVWDLDREFFVDDLPGKRRRTLRQVLDLLRD